MNRAARLRAEDAQAFARFARAAREYADAGRTDEQELQDFLDRIAIGALLDLLSPDERELLHRATLFRAPVPLAVLALLHPRHAADNPASERAVERLGALGLLNRFEHPLDFHEGSDHALIDPLVRPRIRSECSPPGDEEQARWAILTFGPLVAAWGGRRQSGNVRWH